MKIPLLGMGTWGMGGKFERDPSNFDESVEALRYGFELGIRLVDVAELHGGGLTEEIIGEAITGLPRESIFVVSKVSREHLSYSEVLRAAQGSLERLGTTYLDLYLVHKLPPGTTEPLPETFQALEKLLKGGLIRHIGVSNFSAEQIKKASRYLVEAKIEANEIEYNLVYQEAAKKVIPYCRKHHIHLIAHRPLAKGLLVKGENRTLDAMAQKYGKTPAQIALNWIISQNITAIPKTMNAEHMIENRGALEWEMAKEDIELLKQTDGSMPYEKIK